MDARELLKITAQLLGSVTSGYDAIYSEQKKSNGTFIILILSTRHNIEKQN